jgi:signal transduction histidine kinase
MHHWLKLFYTRFLAPRQKDEDVRNREIVLNVILAGTLLIVGLAVLVIIENYLGGMTFLATRAGALSLVFLFVLGIYWLSRRGQYRLAAWLLVGTYGLLAASVGIVWSISLPSAVLLYGLVVVLSGILLGPLYSLIGFGAAVVLIIGTVVLESTGIITYDLTWWQEGPGVDDVFGLSFMLGMIAAVSWLFNYQMARSLKRAQRAEAALVKQKSLLEITVERRTRELQTIQLEKVQQMYRFAELGQLSTAMMHDLANHLTTLTLALEVEDLGGEKRSVILNRARRSIRYIDDMVIRVRDQLQGKSKIRTFNVVQETQKIINMLNHKAIAGMVRLTWEARADKKILSCRGETIRFRQLMANLITNGIDAYNPPASDHEKREVLVSIDADDSEVIISVEDWGRGIPVKERSKLFEPFNSTKKTGMGMGLFIVKQIAEEHFLGSARLDADKKHTVFEIKIPRANT